MTDTPVTGPTPVLSDPLDTLVPATLTQASIVQVPASVAIADATIPMAALPLAGDTTTVAIGTAKVTLTWPTGVTPPPPTGWATKPAFGTRPVGAQKNIVGTPAATAGAIVTPATKTVEIANQHFAGNIGTSNAALRFQYIPAGWTLWIHDCDFANLTWHAIDILASTGITVVIEWCRFSEVTRNAVQFDSVTMTASTIRDCKIKGGLTEDDISVYNSGGVDAAHPFIIERVAFHGTDWTSGSGSGVMFDNATGHGIVRNCTMLDPGQVGIGIPVGSDVHLTDNILYAHQKNAVGTPENVAIYCYTAGNEVARNRIYWLNGSGSQNDFYPSDLSGASGLATNTLADTTINPASLVVTL